MIDHKNAKIKTEEILKRSMTPHVKGGPTPDLQNVKEESKEVQLATPIYHDPEKGKFYYPKIALERDGALERHLGDILEELPPIPEDYIELNNPEEFENLKAAEPCTSKCVCDNDFYSLALSALSFPLTESWETDYPLHCPNLLHTKHSDIQIHPQIDYETVSAEDQLQESREAKELAAETPIYFDAKYSYYYFPQVGLSQQPYARRQIIYYCDGLQPRPLIYLYKSGCFLDLKTGWKYSQMKSLDNYVGPRGLTVKKTIEQINEMKGLATPIVKTGDDSGFFYPNIAIYEVRKRERVSQCL